ncbi:MAG: branched-chain amino acid ABC transporter permease [Rhodospirillaceae bacterium]|nr:branched-chain amino acid ABC transporter permease [Rhodospirillaceae bacterium]
MDAGGLLLYLVALITVGGIYAIMALGLNLNWGMSGLFNVGIAGFFAVGAYTSALLTTPPLAAPTGADVGGFGLPMPVGWIASALLAAAVAWVVGRICLRLRSDYLAIATIGIAEIIRLYALNAQSVTGGAFGIKGIPRPFESLPRPYGELALMALIGLLVVAVYLFMQRAYNSPWGRVMRAIRDNEVAAEAMGKDVEAFRLQSFVIGSAFMGFGGALTAHYLKVLTPEASEPLVATFLVWVMLIVGGSGNNRGAILGAILVWLLWTATELITGALPVEWGVRIAYGRMFLVGLLLVIVLQRFPGGLLPERAAKVREAAPPSA